MRVDEGTTLTAAKRRAPMALDVDAVDPLTMTGWSVVIGRYLEEVHDPDALRRLSSLPLMAWAPGTKKHYLSVQPGKVSGRLISAG